MTEKNDPALWHPMEIMLRDDLYRRAHEQGIDINALCNRALADALGSDHQKIQAPATPSSVIIARDGGAPVVPAAVTVPPSKGLHPVINADDPSASTKVKQAKRQLAAKDQPEAGPLQKAEAEDLALPVVPAAPKKGPAARREKNLSGKRSRHDVLKMFFASSISREDAQGAGVSKDEMFEAFTRWCRERRILPAPDRRSLTVALKNQFALQETVIDGVPSWTGVRLK